MRLKKRAREIPMDGFFILVASVEDLLVLKESRKDKSSADYADIQFLKNIHITVRTGYLIPLVASSVYARKRCMKWRLNTFRTGNKCKNETESCSSKKRLFVILKMNLPKIHFSFS